MDELIDWADVIAIGLLAQTLDYEKHPVRAAIEWHGIGSDGIDRIGPDRIQCNNIANALRKIEAQAYKDGLNEGRCESIRSRT